MQLFRLGIKASLALILMVPFIGPPAASAQSNVLVSFTTTNSTPLNLGFAGFTTELLNTGVEYGDTNMQRLASRLSPGWLLYPGGTSGDAFNWSNGLTDSNWVNDARLNQGQNNNASNLCADTYLPLLGKGGMQFTNFATMAANLGGARIVVCINGFTDTPASAGAFAAFASSNHIPVAAWELCNEPYLFQGAGSFFTNATDYANKMKPYRDAIKAADPNAVVAVFFTQTGLGWDSELGNYTNQYWDAAVYHHYPDLPTNAAFADLMAMDNGVLFSNTTVFVTNVLMADNTNNNVKFLITELNPSRGNNNGIQNPPTSTLYGGIYAAEYVMRLSTIPRMSFAGSYALVNGSGVDQTNRFVNAATTAAAGGYVTNTVGLPFGYFFSAQGSGEAVAYWALNRSTAVYATTIGTNCPVVPMDTNGTLTMPAIYAQAYQGGNGKRYVLLTNKGSNAVPVQITQDGVALTNQFLETFVSGSDPSVVNSNPPSNNVVIQTMTVTNPVTIPEYSVMRLEWAVFTVPPPTLGLTVSNTAQNLNWVGLTNVVYNVQGVTNLLESWTTLGRVANTTTNFSFTDWNSGSQQFYRLAVP
ncbi:MAG TPA: hypothetical protein VN836_00415 [Verrucomicrobiae bacterium]|nr:hypothetical protein [Verrucomicrobiae bacterium]